MGILYHLHPLDPGFGHLDDKIRFSHSSGNPGNPVRCHDGDLGFNSLVNQLDPLRLLLVLELNQFLSDFLDLRCSDPEICTISQYHVAMYVPCLSSLLSASTVLAVPSALSKQVL